MKLNKRNCNIRIRLTPCGGDFTKVQIKIGDEINDFFLSGVMGSQFSSLLTAVYCLYEEDGLEHWHYRRRNPELKREFPNDRKNGLYATKAEFDWNGEGCGCAAISIIRECADLTPQKSNEPDPIKISFGRKDEKTYTVDGRDLCYAVAKACTEALKKYGFKGYLQSNSGYYLGDSIDIEKLLFIKAYALDAMEVRKTSTVWEDPKGWMHADASSFEKEMELLTFDM